MSAGGVSMGGGSSPKADSRARARDPLLYDLALPVVGPDLAEVPDAERVTVDRIARALEAQGSGSALRHRTAILRALGEHLRAQHTDAQKALRYLARLDRRLAVWGACACARGVLRLVPVGEERPRIAIETTERWLAGQATLDEVREARRGAWAAWSADAAADAAYAVAGVAGVAGVADAAYAAAGVAYAVAVAAAAAAGVAVAAAAAAAAAADARAAVHAAELTRLVGVVADALPGLPPEVLT